MNTRDLSLASMVLLVVLGVHLAPSGIKQTPKPGSTSTKSKSGDSYNPTPPVWKALCRLNPSYGADPNKDEELQTIPDHALDPKCLSQVNPTEDWIIPVIATVADPVKTNLGLWTDRTIEAIQAASTEAGYIPYLQGLQWPIPASITSQADSTNGQASSNASDEKSPRKLYDSRYPGVLIFRSSDSSTDQSHAKYLAVFLVSETPTGGLNKEQFLSAIRIIGNIPRNSSSGSDKKQPRTVLVAGPSFSGSVPSLRDLASLVSQPTNGSVFSFATTLDPVRCVRALSGTITNANSSPLPNHELNCGLRLDTVQTDDQVALNALLKWATGVGIRQNQIAILSEEGTRYGRQESYGGQNASNDFLRLHFPRGIAALRNATNPEENPTLDTPAGTGPQRLPLRWQDSESQSDEVPLYGAYQTSLSEETVLASLADTLKSEDIKVLGILASDPWDVDFLIRWFTEASPNVRLFVRDVDLLYLRTPDVGSLTGVLAVNDYPLISENQFWSADQAPREDRHLLTFPSSLQESQFNAFVELLEQLRPTTDPPLRHLEDQGPSIAMRGAPQRHLWLAATGTNGYLPIKPLWDEKYGLTNTGGNLHRLNPGKPPYSAVVIWLLIAIVAFSHAIGVFISVVSGDKSSGSGQQRKVLKGFLPCFLTFDLEDRFGQIATSKMVCHAVGLSTAALATLIAGASFVFFWRSHFRLTCQLNFIEYTIAIRPYPLLAFFVLLITLFVTVIACWALWIGIKASRYRCQPGPLTFQECRHLRGLSGCGLLFTAFSLAGMIFWLDLIASKTFDHAFMHLRDLQLGSGIAPVVPILFLIAVFYCGIWVFLRRVSLWEFGSVEMPTKLDDIFPSNCNRQVDRITRAFLQFPDAPWGWVLVGCLVGGLLLFRPWTTMDMLEPRTVQYFTVLWFFLVSLLLWSNWLRFIYTWQQMQLFLRILEKLPLRAAFSRISTQSTLSIWGWNVAPGKLLPLREGVEALRALHRLTGNTFVTAATRKKFLSLTRTFLIATSDSALDDIAQPIEPEEPFRQVGKTKATASTDSNNIETVIYRAQTLTVVDARQTAALAQEVLSSQPEPKEFAQLAPLIVTIQGSDNRTCVTESNGATERVSVGHVKRLYHEFRQAMTEMINELVPHLYTYWHRGEVWPGNPPISLDRPRRKTDSEDQRYELAEELVALRFYSYIRYVGTELRNLLIYVVIAFFAIFVALHTYAFRASRAIDLAFITLFVVLTLGIVLTFGQQERDALLSRLQGSTAGELGKNFYVDILKYAAIPAVALIASQVPSISNFFLRWIQPGLDAFH